MSRANLPVFEALYKSVKDGSETRRSLEFNSRKTYRQDLQKELDEIDQQEIWRAGKTVRALRVRPFVNIPITGTGADHVHSPMPSRTRSKCRAPSCLLHKHKHNPNPKRHPFILRWKMHDLTITHARAGCRGQFAHSTRPPGVSRTFFLPAPMCLMFPRNIGDTRH